MVLLLEWNRDDITADIDAAFGVHPDLRSQLGIYICMGRGAYYSRSLKHKLNTKRLTEAELVAVNDSIVQVLWTRYFMLAQGYKIRETKVFQDNISAILLAKHGKESSGRRIRHLDVRYIFIKDQIDSGEITMVCEPREDLMADYFTKAL